MQEPNLIRYISELNIKAPVAGFNRSAFRSEGGVAPEPYKFDSQADQSFFSDKSTISFVAGVSDQNRQDVINSTLLAQLAANKKYPDGINSHAWVHSFEETMSNIGWVIEGSELSTFATDGNLFEIDSAILEVLISAFGQNYISIIKSTIHSIQKLGDKDNRIQVFEKNTHSLSQGFFQMGLVNEQNGAVSLRMGSFFINSSDKIEKILFFRSAKENSRMTYFSKKATLNPQIYGTIRNTVIEKLGTATIKYVDKIDI